MIKRNFVADCKGQRSPPESTRSGLRCRRWRWWQGPLGLPLPPAISHSWIKVLRSLLFTWYFVIGWKVTWLKGCLIPGCNIGSVIVSLQKAWKIVWPIPLGHNTYIRIRQCDDRSLGDLWLAYQWQRQGEEGEAGQGGGGATWLDRHWCCVSSRRIGQASR